MKKIVMFLWVLGALVADKVSAESAVGFFDFNDNIREAYDQALNFRLKEANVLLAAERADRPNNRMIQFVENYIDYYTVLISMDKSEFNRLTAVRDARLNLIANHSDPASPYYRYVQADILLQWGLLRGFFNDTYNAVRETKRAYKLLQDNQLAFPNFIANRKNLGLVKTIFSSVPESYQWATNLVGMKATFEEGLADIQAVLKYAEKNDFVFERDTRLSYAYLLSFMGEYKNMAWQIVSHPSLKPNESHYVAFIKANIGLNTFHANEVIEMLEELPEDKNFAEVRFLKYYLGKAKLYRQDADADQYFLAYLRNPQGAHLVKASYRFLAWHYATRNRMDLYEKYAALCLEKGSKFLYDDESAFEEIRDEPAPPHPVLLQARVLFDGGFFAKSKEVLGKMKPELLKTTRQKSEYWYRLARANESLGLEKEAVSHYKQAMVADASSYMACRAALQIAESYESQKQYANAQKFYEQCLAMNPDRYKTSLHQQAKAGLNRVK